jgi:hypothetical protein
MTELTDQELEGFIEGVKAKRVANLGGDGETPYFMVAEAKDVTAQIGSKYVRIVAAGSAYCFIDRATGDILKTASWKTPAKHPRGTVHTPTFGVEFVGPYGAAYLR